MPLTPTFEATPNAMFQPAYRLVTGITNAVNCVVTTSFPHQYFSGTIIRMVVPNGFGMTQINGLFAPLTVLSDTTFSLPIDTTNFDLFANSGTNYAQTAICSPVGEINSSLQAATQNVLRFN